MGVGYMIVRGASAGRLRDVTAGMMSSMDVSMMYHFAVWVSLIMVQDIRPPLPHSLCALLMLLFRRAVFVVLAGVALGLLRHHVLEL